MILRILPRTLRSQNHEAHQQRARPVADFGPERYVICELALEPALRALRHLERL